ncbi:unnamed protein product [Strongylus vulgaris]|uniref:Uncharacterized protein n=1 Tax=Strongylus vulgaris TaxID=40348 RepID=A0A3P7KSM8_STRVU|nr:unnamed protein product [Strongylus vulgaris]
MHCVVCPTRKSYMAEKEGKFSLWPHSNTLLTGRFQESEESRKRIAKMSGMEFEPMQPPEDKGELKQPEKKIGILDVFKEPQLRKNLLVLWMM